MKFSDKSYRGNLRRDIGLFVLVGIFLVAQDTWLFKSDEFLKKFEIVARFIIPIILLIFFRKYIIPHKAKVVLALYGTLIFYMLCMVFFLENPSLIILNTVKYLYCLVFAVSLLLILRPSSFSYSFLYIPVYLGLFFSIQTIILFVLIQTGYPPESHIDTLVGYKNMAVLSYGPWGYAHGMMAIGSNWLQVYRAQSFFGEPTVFASFLEVSAILSFGLYRIRKDKKMLIASMLCAISLIITFSMTAYIVIFFTLSFNYIVIHWKRLRFLKVVILIIVIPIAFFIILGYLQSATNENFYGQSKLGMAFGHSPIELEYRINFLIDSIRFLLEHPFGIGIIGIEDSNVLKDYPGAGSRIAPFVWIVNAGIVGFAIQFIIIFYLFKKIIVKYVTSFGRIERYIGLSFVISIFHHCVAGDWFTAMFFYLLSSLIVTDAYRFSFLSASERSFIKKDRTDES